MTNSRTLCFVLVVAFLITACGQAVATPTPIYTVVSAAKLNPGSAIPAPSGPVIMKIDGKISNTNSGKTLQLDMPTLESMGVVQYKVFSPFDKKTVLYAGVLFSQLLKVAGASPDATTLTLKALDDYSTDMKIADVNKWPILLATRADGAYMPLDKSGPLISVFPFNDFPEIDHVTYDAQWLWSLAAITVK